MVSAGSRVPFHRLLSSLLLLSFVASSFALFAFPPRAHADAVVIFLTSGASWTVPGDWNNGANTVECIGGGGSGSSTNGGGGGGGGGYSKSVNLSLTIGGSISYAVGSVAGDTWFNSASFPSSGQSCGARGGATGSGLTGGIGGGAASGYATGSGSQKQSGGNGGTMLSAGGAGGGGGAGGPNGDGGGGGGGFGGTSPFYGGGGGGGNGGAVGGNGGNGTGLGGAGAAGGGNGGNGNTNPGTPGGAGSVWTATLGGSAGPGGGGGGDGITIGAGGSGGLYGGGGGGKNGGAVGVGAQGIIVITYTPISAPDAPANLITTSVTGAVSLSWNVPASNGGANLETYGIWRATSPFTATTSATLIASIATTSTSYSDMSVVLRTTYYYRVTATNGTATSSLSNQRVSNANSGRIIRLGGVRLR